MDDNLDAQAKRMRGLPLKLAFDWADGAARTLSNTLDDMGHFNAGSKADRIAEEIRGLRREVLS